MPTPQGHLPSPAQGGGVYIMTPKDPSSEPASSEPAAKKSNDQLIDLNCAISFMIIIVLLPEILYGTGTKVWKMEESMAFFHGFLPSSSMQETTWKQATKTMIPLQCHGTGH